MRSIYGPIHLARYCRYRFYELHYLVLNTQAHSTKWCSFYIGWSLPNLLKINRWSLPNLLKINRWSLPNLLKINRWSLPNLLKINRWSLPNLLKINRDRWTENFLDCRQAGKCTAAHGICHTQQCICQPIGNRKNFQFICPYPL